jgi:hypothetical protein
MDGHGQDIDEHGHGRTQIGMGMGRTKIGMGKAVHRWARQNTDEHGFVWQCEAG